MSRFKIGLIPKERRKRIFSRYIEEVLLTEGIINYSFISLNELSQCIAVIVYDDIDYYEWEELLKYIREGGKLILIRPPISVCEELGLGFEKRLSDYVLVPKYVSINYANLLVRDLVDKPIQVVVDAELYKINCNEYEVLAYYNICYNRRTNYPAIISLKYEKSRVVVFTYDVIENIVLLRQGRYENSSKDIDGCGAHKPNDLFIGLIDPRLKWIPQADIHMRLLTRTIEYLIGDVFPLIRVWYFPKLADGIVIMTGDSDVMSKEDFELLVRIIEKYNATYTLFLRPEELHVLEGYDINELKEKGLTLGYHTFPGFKPTISEAKERISRQIKLLNEKGVSASVHRGHCTIWVGWVDMAKILRKNGVRMDFSYYPYRYFQTGYLNCSGLAMKFIDENGEILDIYEQSTQWADDVALTDKTFLDPIPMDRLIELTKSTIKESLSKYHTAITFCIHPFNMRTNILNSKVWLEEVLKYCDEKGVPILDASTWLEYNDLRRSIKLINFSENNGIVIYTIKASRSVTSLTLMVPYKYKSKTLSYVEANGKRIKFKLKVINGSRYGFLRVDFNEGINYLRVHYT